MPAAKPGPDGTTATRDARRLSTLIEVSQALSGTLNLKASMQRVLQILSRHHGVVRGMVLNFNRYSGYIVSAPPSADIR